MAEKLKPEFRLPADRKIKIITIEKDGDLVKLLKAEFTENENIEIIQGDALKSCLIYVPSFMI